MRMAFLALISRAAGAALAPPHMRMAFPQSIASRVRMCSSQSRTLIAEVQVLPSPIGTADDEYKHVDAAIAAIAASGLETSVSALGTTIEGPADEVWTATRAAFDACLASGASSEMMVLKMYAPGSSSVSVESLQASGRQLRRARRLSAMPAHATALASRVTA